MHFKDKYIPVNVKFYDLQTEILQLIIMIFIGYYPKHEKQDNWGNWTYNNKFHKNKHYDNSFQSYFPFYIPKMSLFKGLIHNL